MNESKLKEIKPGQEFKNYKELCKILDEKTKTGNSKISQMKEWNKYFDYNKEGQKIIITKIENPYISERDMVMKYGTLDLINYYLENNCLSSVKKKQFTNLLKEKIEYKETKYGYKIIKNLEYQAPRNIAKMKTGMYQFIIPLILNNIVQQPTEEVFVLSTHKLAKTIDMVNPNYSTMFYFSKAIQSTDEFNLENENINDYYKKVDSYIKYYLENALKYMDEAHMIAHQKILYVELVKSKKEIQDEEGNTIVIENEDKVQRRATSEEINLNLIWEQEAMRLSDINPLENGMKECYHGKKAKDFSFNYNSLRKGFNKDKEYKITKFYKVNEIIPVSKDYCNYCLSYFNTDNIVDNFNNYFMTNILSNANKRNDKENSKYNETYIDDYTKLINITIPKNSESLFKNPIIKEAINNSMKKYVEYKKSITYSDQEKICPK